MALVSPCEQDWGQDSSSYQPLYNPILTRYHDDSSDPFVSESAWALCPLALRMSGYYPFPNEVI